MRSLNGIVLERLVGKPPVRHSLACPRCTGLYSFYAGGRATPQRVHLGSVTFLSLELLVNSCYNVLLLVAFICKRVLINNLISRVFYWLLPYHRVDKNSL